MFGIQIAGAAFTEIIIQPGKVRLDGHVAYRFVFGGIVWAMLVSSHSLSATLNQCVLRANGDTVLLVRDAREMDNLSSFAVELQRMERSP